MVFRGGNSGGGVGGVTWRSVDAGADADAGCFLAPAFCSVDEGSERVPRQREGGSVSSMR